MIKRENGGDDESNMFVSSIPQTRRDFFPYLAGLINIDRKEGGRREVVIDYQEKGGELVLVTIDGKYRFRFKFGNLSVYDGGQASAGKLLHSGIYGVGRAGKIDLLEAPGPITMVKHTYLKGEPPEEYLSDPRLLQKTKDGKVLVGGVEQVALPARGSLNYNRLFVSRDPNDLIEWRKRGVMNSFVDYWSMREEGGLPVWLMRADIDVVHTGDDRGMKVVMSQIYGEGSLSA